MKLLIPPPQADETITSVLDRAASLYATTRAELAEELVRLANGHRRVNLDGVDLDVNPPPELAEALGKVLGSGAQAINRLCLPASKWLLDPDCRTAYCPNCFDEDLVTTGSVYLRREWAFSFITHCRRHHRTLIGPVSLKWKPTLSLTRDLTLKLRLDSSKYAGSYEANCWQRRWSQHEEWDDYTPALRALWKRLCKFEVSLLAASFGHIHHRNARMEFYRDLVMLFSGNWDYSTMRPAIARLMPVAFTNDLRIFICPKNSLPDYDIHAIWAYFLAQPDPSWRRGVTWVLMQYGHPSGPVCIHQVYSRTPRRLRALTKIPRDQWFKTCLDELPEYGRWLARAFAERWPPPYRCIIEKLELESVHLDVEELNALYVEKHMKDMRALVTRLPSWGSKIQSEHQHVTG